MPGMPLSVVISLKQPLQRALGRRTVVADDVVDQRIVEDAEILERVDQAADVMVGLLEESRVDLHLPRQHRLEIVGHVVPGRDLGVARGELGVLRNDAQLLLPCEDLFAQLVPAAVELAFVLVRPLLGNVMRRVGRAGSEVHEERLIRHRAPSAGASR